MKWQLLAAVLLLGFSLPARPPDAAEAVSVDRMCGKLVSIREISQKGESAGQGTMPVSHARLQLFAPTANGDCCTLMEPVAEVISGHDGEFRFKKAAPGDYWLVATVSGNEFKLLIRYEPGKKSDKDCSAFQYTIEKGKLLLRRSTTVSVS